MLKLGNEAWIHRHVSFHHISLCDQDLPSGKIKWNPTLALVAGDLNLALPVVTTSAGPWDDEACSDMLT